VWGVLSDWRRDQCHLSHNEDEAHVMKERYLRFDDLPHWVQDFVRQICCGEEQTWVYEPVPALDGKSVMDLMNDGEEGERRVRAYVTAVIGKFF
jgi:hypothetical protein